MNIREFGEAGSPARSAIARKAVTALERTRAAANVPVLKKTLSVDGVVILLTTTAAFQKIIYLGKTFFPRIFLSTAETNTIYDFLKDSFGSASIFVGTALGPGYGGRCQCAAGSNTYSDRSWSNEALSTMEGFRYVGNAHYLGVGVYSGFAEARLVNDIGVVSLPYPVADESDAARRYFAIDQAAVSISAVSTGYDWANQQTLDLYRFEGAGEYLPTFTWAPSFFFAEPGNEYERVTGWFYGVVTGSWGLGSQLQPLIVDGTMPEPTVQFLGFLHPRAATPRYQFGYAETFLQGSCPNETGWINGVLTNTETNFSPTTPTVTFFAQEQTPEGIDTITWYGFRTSGGTVQWGGTTPAGNGRMVFQIERPFGDATAPDSIDWWTHYSWYDEDADLTDPNAHPDAMTVGLIAGSRAVFYKFHGYLHLVHDTTAYHSHYTSEDGSTLTIFEGANGVISMVTVYDLFGTRRVAFPYQDLAQKANDQYVNASVSIIRNRDISGYQADGGCYIFHRPKGTVYPELNFTGVSTAVADHLRSPALAGMFWFPDATTGPQIFKIKTWVTETGKVFSSALMYRDICHRSGIFIVEPPGNPERFLASWDSGVPHAIYLWRGAISGSFENDYFAGTGADEAVFSITALPGTIQEFENGSGVSTYGMYGSDTEIEGPNPPPHPSRFGDITYVKWRATSECGQVAVVEKVVPKSEPSPCPIITVIGAGDPYPENNPCAISVGPGCNGGSDIPGNLFLGNQGSVEDYDYWDYYYCVKCPSECGSVQGTLEPDHVCNTWSPGGGHVGWYAYRNVQFYVNDGEACPETWEDYYNGLEP